MEVPTHTHSTFPRTEPADKMGRSTSNSTAKKKRCIFVALKRRRVFRTTVKGRRGSSLYKTRKEGVLISALQEKKR
jgi:hypothetical protein